MVGQFFIISVIINNYLYNTFINKYSNTRFSTDYTEYR